MNKLLAILQEKGSVIPPIVFQMSIWLQTELPKNEHQTSKSNKSNKSNDSHSSVNESDFEIGLGDFIFFSFISGVCYIYTSMIGAIFTILSIITGLTLTLVLLIICDHPLPALPIPITLGLITQLLFQFSGHDFGEALNAKLIFI